MYFPYLLYIFKVSFNFCKCFFGLTSSDIIDLFPSSYHSIEELQEVKQFETYTMKNFFFDFVYHITIDAVVGTFLIFCLLLSFIQCVWTCHIDSFVPLSPNVKAGLLAI